MSTAAGLNPLLSAWDPDPRPAHTSGADAVWRWYCRIDGAAGEADTRQARDDAAVAHSDTECWARDKARRGWAEVGHLIHVWRW